MISVESINVFHQTVTQDWHAALPECDEAGFMKFVCQQHRFNFMLWHEEDIARSPTATDAQIAAVKRSIDKLNQSRNDATEQIDMAIADYLQSTGVSVDASVPMNSETPGSVIDRLSILALRLFHLLEQFEREAISEDLRESINSKIQIVRSQQQDLSTCLTQLWDDICCGRKRHKIYRQLKMYNDPNLNPYLYAERQDQT